VTHIGIFAGEKVVTAAVPRPGGRCAEAGRGLSRERLDTLLLECAARAGADVYQPCSAEGLCGDGNAYRVQADWLPTGAGIEWRTRLVVLAHGSWEMGALPSQHRPPGRATDLLAFKAHYRGGSLQPGLMSLLTMPGAYGGIVHCSGGRFSLSFCVRRDALGEIRRRAPGLGAGEAVVTWAQEHCRGAREALAGAELDGPWLAAGPLQPGVRLRLGHGIFPVGNIAGEVHPAAAEGISIAMQSAWLLASRLIAWRNAGGAWPALAEVGASYTRAWRRAFAPRIHAGSIIAEWSMRPTAVAGVIPFLRYFPHLLSLGARLTGKARLVKQ
jgi:flavin-dependent dehydrogenase